MSESPITLKQLVQAVIIAGSILREGHRNLFVDRKSAKVKLKSNGTPVARMDLDINAMMMSFTEKHGLGLIAEEGNGTIDHKFILYVDPVDGTEAVLRGMNTATVIATVMKMEGSHGFPIMSAIYEPMVGHIWAAEAGYFTRYSNTVLRLDPYEVNTDSVPSGKIKTAVCLWPGASHNLDKVSASIIADPKFDDQQMGAFGIGAGLIASGLIHATVCGATAATEAAAMTLIVRGAGGIAADLNGHALKSFELGQVRDKVDFKLPHGALFASDIDVANIVGEKVSESNQ